jgi:hypothetical protein
MNGITEKRRKCLSGQVRPDMDFGRCRGDGGGRASSESLSNTRISACCVDGYVWKLV